MPGCQLRTILCIFVCALGLLTEIAKARAASVLPVRCSDENKRVGLYAYPWKGDVTLGRSVASILSMQVWVTLRKTDPHVSGSDFGCGLIERISPKAPLFANLQLTGLVQRIGPDAVVQASLKKVTANDHRLKRAEVWTVSYNGKAVQFDPLKDFYSFAPFAISGAALKTYATLQTVRLCRQPRLPCNAGALGTADLDGEVQEGDFAKVRLGDGRRAWIYLPKLSDRSEIVDFVAALIRLQRGDYLGADLFFDQVKTTIAGTGTRVEALILQAVARELAGRSGEDCIAEAAKLNPLMRSVVEVRVMKSLQVATRTADQAERRRLAEEVKGLLDNSAKLFDPTDLWLQQAFALTAVL